jgi:hypothetical protein
VNLEPESLQSPEVLDVFRACGNLGGLVVEITEHRPIEDPEKIQWILERLRTDGALLAVDDAGSGYAGLQQILTLRPDILKLDRALIVGVDTDETKAALVEMFGIFANRIDGWLLAEGIETIGEARRCAALGVPLAQGYLFARPAAPWADIEAGVEQQLLGSARWRDGATLHSMIEFAPAVHASQLDDARAILATGDATHVVLVDDDRRPTGMFTLESMLSGVTLQALRSNVNSSPHEVAHRLSTSITGHTLVPVMVSDNEGHYLGTVSIQRLLATVASLLHHSEFNALAGTKSSVDRLVLPVMLGTHGGSEETGRR